MNITQTCMHAFIHPHQRHIDHPILLFPPMHIHSQLTKINNTNQNGNTSWFVSLWSLSLSLSPTDRENKETKSTFMGFAGIRLHYNIPALPEILREKEIERGGEGGRERDRGLVALNCSISERSTHHLHTLWGERFFQSLMWTKNFLTNTKAPRCCPTVEHVASEST